jgi:hypothetical protein
MITTAEREVIKLVQRIPGKGLVSLNVYHFACNGNWLLTYPPEVVASPTQPDSLIFAYESLAHAQALYEQYLSRTRVAVEAWRAVTTASEPFPEGILLTNRLHRWADFWQWYARREQEAFLPFDSSYSPETGTVLCRDLKLIERIGL